MPEGYAEELKTFSSATESWRQVGLEETEGYNLRVLVDGSFGFAASYDFDKPEKVVSDAVGIATGFCQRKQEKK